MNAIVTEQPLLKVANLGRTFDVSAPFLQRLVTRLYFGDEEEANAADPVLCSLRYPDEVKRTLIAAPVDGGYRFDIRLQGEDETLFFAV